jgi:hypothetical protein
MWVNLGVLPFWFILIFFPQSHLCRIFVASIFPIFVLSGVYIFVLYKSYLIGYDFIGNFTLYLGLDDLSRLFEDHLYLMLFGHTLLQLIYLWVDGSLKTLKSFTSIKY